MSPNQSFRVRTIALLVASTTLGAGLGWKRTHTDYALAIRAEKPPKILHRREHDGMEWIPGGKFIMGNSEDGAPSNEQPPHLVGTRGFWMDRAPVTNREFALFVASTGYKTTAERKPDWNSLRVQLPTGTPRPPSKFLVPGAMVFVGARGRASFNDYTRWWRYVPGANWLHPQGPDSSIVGKEDHPVVQISYNDAIAYAAWIGKRLPTEAEWEYAARGGLQQARYTWGNDLEPAGTKMANIWDESAEPFPLTDSNTPSVHHTTAVCTYPRNGFGLCDMAGNTWQWTSDWYRSDAYSLIPLGRLVIDPQGPDRSFDAEHLDAPANAPKKVIRGGSFLCSQSYCMSYRPSARRGNDPFTSMSHLGFRLVAN